MQCFICVTYLMIICSAYPPKNPEVSRTVEKRSLFRDVIESLRIRAQLPEDLGHNEDNNLSQNYERYGFENEPLQLPGDSEFVPRRNDRIEMPSLKYRFPKSIVSNDSNVEKSPKKEIVVYVETPSDVSTKTTTVKPKNTKRPRPQMTKKPNKNVENEDTETESETDQRPSNTLTGQSQIGNRESQTVIKPTVIVNFRGTVSHKESEIRLERRNENDTAVDVPLTVFNIKQDIKLERSGSSMGANGVAENPDRKVKQDTVVIANKIKSKLEDDLMMCESNSFKDENDRNARKYDVLQILLTI